MKLFNTDEHRKNWKEWYGRYWEFTPKRRISQDFANEIKVKK